MEQLTRKICLFLLLTVLLSGRASELGTLVGAITGTILLWPLYARITTCPQASNSQRTADAPEHEEVTSR